MESTESISLRIVAVSEDRLKAQDFATFIYDLNLLYELRVLERLDPDEISPLYATPWILARNQRSIPEDAKLQLVRAHYGSPVDLLLQLPTYIAAFVAASGGLWALTQALEKLYNLPANKRLLEAQRRLAVAQARKVESELETGTPGLSVSTFDESHQRPHSKRGFDPIVSAENRLRRARIRVIDIDLEVPDERVR